MNKQKRIIFMGTPDYATVIFEKLLENSYNIVALFTQPDKPIGRKQVLTPPHIKQFCLEHGLSLPIHQPGSLKDLATFEIVKKLKPDIIIVAAYGQILPKNILDLAPCINLHASLLPKYRGASPIQQALLDNQEYTGITAMLMDIGLDSGDILGLKYIKIGKNIVVSELFNMLSVGAASLTLEILENFEKIKPKKQNVTLVSHCGKVNKKDGLVNFDNADKFYSKYKAYKSWPDIYLESGLKIKECILHESNSINESGKIIKINKTTIVVGCKRGSIEIITVQQPSKKAINVVDYIRGARVTLEDYLS